MEISKKKKKIKKKKKKKKKKKPRRFVWGKNGGIGTNILHHFLRPSQPRYGILLIFT
jgi:hypothetical protein